MELPDDATVLRGGRLDGERLLRGCGCHAGVFGFSVQCAAGLAIHALAEAGRIPHGLVGVTTVGDIRARGFDVVSTSGKGHHATVVVPVSLDPQEADGLAAIFKLEPNPLRGENQ